MTVEDGEYRCGPADGAEIERNAKWLRRLGCVMISTLLAGCSHVVGGEAVRQPLPGESNCAPATGPMATIEPKHDDEPVMRIPRPPHWQRNRMLDSELIRYAMSDHALTASRFAPTVAVTLEDVTTKTASPEQIIAGEWAGVRALAGGTDIVVTSNRPVCGLPAQTVTYRLPQMGPIPSRVGVGLAVVTTGVRKYAAVVSVQTTEPNNPTYVADSTAIIDGFQIMPEAG